MKYHAQRNTKLGNAYGNNLCGRTSAAAARGVTSVSPVEWNALQPEERCSHCVAAIKKRKAAKAN